MEGADIVSPILSLQETNMSLHSLQGSCNGFPVLVKTDGVQESFAFRQSYSLGEEIVCISEAVAVYTRMQNTFKFMPELNYTCRM